MKLLLNKITSSKFIMSIQAIATLLLVAMIFRLNMLPTKYLAVVVAILFIIWILFFVLTRDTKKRSKGKAFAKIISLLLSITLTYGSLMAIQGTNLLSSITGGDTQTHTYAVIVLADNPAEELSDLDGKTFGVNTKTDYANVETTITEMEKEISPLTTVETDDFGKLADLLYDGEVDAIIASEAYRGLMENTYENFGTETKVIWTYGIEEKVEDISKEVDVTNESFNVLITGIDTYGSVSTVSRSDVNMIMTINPNTKEILLTSIPRDYYVDLPSLNAKDKLTHAGIYGVDESVGALEGLFGIDINYYAKVNFTSVVDIVDALGGITVQVDQPATLLHHNNTVLSVGSTHMDGDLALAFSRERYSYTDGDNQRVINQQLVISGIVDKLTSPAILTSYSSFLSSIDGSVETNMSTSEIQSLIKMQLDEGGSWTITSNAVTGSGGYEWVPSYSAHEVYVMYPNQESVDNAISMINEVMGE